jgi:hypothetical protein
MSCTYTKLSSDIIHSSVWRESMATKLTWVTMLAMADQYGRVGASIPGLAAAAGVSLKQVEAALACFLAPDPYSRTPDHEGRRIEKTDKGWRLLNYEKNRNEKDEEHQKKRNAERQARWREKHRNAESNGVTRYVTESNPIAEAEASVDDDDDDVEQSHSGSRVPQKEVLGETSPICSAEAAKFMKTFGPLDAGPEDVYEPSARILQLADVFGHHLKVAQDMDFNYTVLRSIPDVEATPETVVHSAVAFVLAENYWMTQMLNENEGRGGLKVFIRGFSKIVEISKSKGKGNNGRRVAAKAKPPVYKASSVAPDPTASTYAPMETY